MIEIVALILLFIVILDYKSQIRSRHTCNYDIFYPLTDTFCV